MRHVVIGTAGHVDHGKTALVYALTDVQTDRLPEEQRRDLEQWAGCVAGALPIEDYLDAVRDAGFVDVKADYESGTERKQLTARTGDDRQGIATSLQALYKGSSHKCVP